jgi:hypothetical protein
LSTPGISQEVWEDDLGDSSSPVNTPGDRLPVGWEKKIGAMDRKWFLDGNNGFITDEELQTYVRTMGWSESSRPDRAEWLATILHGLDRALEGGPKEKRDRQPPKQFPTLAGNKDTAVISVKKKKPAATMDKAPAAAGVDMMWETGAS